MVRELIGKAAVDPLNRASKASGHCADLAAPARDTYAICNPRMARRRSLLEPANKRHQGLDLVVGQHATERLHLFLAVLVLQSFLDLFEHLLIGERRLISCIR